jgi:hypothetical protein
MASGSGTVASASPPIARRIAQTSASTRTAPPRHCCAAPGPRRPPDPTTAPAPAPRRRTRSVEPGPWPSLPGTGTGARRTPCAVRSRPPLQENEQKTTGVTSWRFGVVSLRRVGRHEGGRQCCRSGQPHLASSRRRSPRSSIRPPSPTSARTTSQARPRPGQRGRTPSSTSEHGWPAAAAAAGQGAAGGRHGYAEPDEADLPATRRFKTADASPGQSARGTPCQPVQIVEHITIQPIGGHCRQEGDHARLLSLALRVSAV